MAEQKKLNLKLDFLKPELYSSLNASIMSFNNSVNNDVNIWAQTDLRRNVENSMSKFAGIIQENESGNSFGNVGSKLSSKEDVFRFNLSLQIMIGYKVKETKWKLGATIAFKKKWPGLSAINPAIIDPAFDPSIDTVVGFGIYGNLGSTANLEFDLTASVDVIAVAVGGFREQLSYNSPMTNLNDFINSFKYGQALTRNSTLNKENKFSFDQIQQEGLVGFRIGDVNICTNNDTEGFPYYGGGTDKGYTGGISIVMPFLDLEIGSQTFTGDYLAHKQSQYQQNLNKSPLHIQFNDKGFNSTIDFISDAPLQNFIYKRINNHFFIFDNKELDLSL